MEEPKPANRLAAEFTNALGMKLVLIPAGTFIMGSPLIGTGISLRARYGSARTCIGLDSGQSRRQLVVVRAALSVCQSDSLHAF